MKSHRLNRRNWPRTIPGNRSACKRSPGGRSPGCASVRAAALIALLVSVVGCGGEKPVVDGRTTTYATTGTVLQDGAPVEGAIVIFHASQQNLSANGKTDVDGTFALTTYDQGDGAVVGTHAVSITKTQFNATPDPRGEPFPPKTEEVSPLAKKYADPKTSGLTADVSPDIDNQFQFELAPMQE